MREKSPAAKHWAKRAFHDHFAPGLWQSCQSVKILKHLNMSESKKNNLPVWHREEVTYDRV